MGALTSIIWRITIVSDVECFYQKYKWHVLVRCPFNICICYIVLANKYEYLNWVGGASMAELIVWFAKNLLQWHSFPEFLWLNILFLIWENI